MNAFISYSHHDEKALGRLHKHLAMLRREGLLEAWYDREILAGTPLDSAIEERLQKSALFLALISPDFLDSNYCYEKEMTFALQRHKEGELHVIPIIVEPCDWRSSPLGELKALPKDAQPISLWANENVAYLDVVTELRRLIQAEPSARTRAPAKASSAPASTPRRYRIKADFDRIDREEFQHRAFTVIRDYFRNSVEELNRIGEPIRARFESMGDRAFTCTILNKARRGGEANLTVHERGMIGAISYSKSHHADANTANGFIQVEANEYELFLKVDRSWSHGEQDHPLSPEQAAETLWEQFLADAGITYD